MEVKRDSKSFMNIMVYYKAMQPKAKMSIMIGAYIKANL
jgi:hypothetical protein